MNNSGIGPAQRRKDMTRLIIGSLACVALLLPGAKVTTTVHAAAQVIAATVRIEGPLGAVNATQVRSLVHGPFHVRSCIGRCLTYGLAPQLTTGAPSQAGSAPVFIDNCNRAGRLQLDLMQRPQDIVVQEIDIKHDVILRAGNKAVGVTAGFLVNQATLELQDLN
jgi:hypothetical protein